MKKLGTLIITIFLLGLSTSFAQFKFGVKGGVNFANVNGFNTTYIQAAENITRFHGGIMTEIKLPVLGVQADLLYSAKGSTLTDAFDGSVSDFKSNYIDIPIVLKLYILKILNLHVGPQFEFLLSADNGGVDVKDQFKSSHMSGVVGAGLELSFLYAALRYNFGLSTIGVENSPAFDTAKLNTFQASVGIWLSK
jgi:hypothetical protein